MKPWRSHIPQGSWPRRMPGNMAAAYVGRCYTTFKSLVENEKLPKAVEPGFWDRAEIDSYLDGRNKLSDPVADTKRDLETMYG